MNELNYYKLFHRASALTSPNFIRVAVFGTNEEVYLKSEADKVLEEKDKELRHQKYKRCLSESKYWLAVSYQCVDDKHRQNAKRHRRKWLELANKFKEAK